MSWPPEPGDAHGPALPAHLYLHVPFCRSKCAYCDFASGPETDMQTVLAVFMGLESEVRRWGTSGLQGVVETVYVGGGTPSLHPAQVASLLRRVRADLPVHADAEVTVEANPDSLTPVALETMLEAGANRVSLGVQALDDGVLRLLGRPHDVKQARAALSLLAESGASFSADLMCGVPGQTIHSWRESVEQVLDAGVRHLSVYPLSIEEGTALGVAVAGGLVDAPDPDLAADMMLYAQERLSEEGLVRYEVASYTAPGCESRHNTAYWTGRSYIGAGPGAHGMLDVETARAVGFEPPVLAEGRAVQRLRYANLADTQRWLFGVDVETEWLAADAVLREDVMLGLRLARGVTERLADEAGVTGALESLERDGLVEHAGGRWRTTQRGWLLGNEVFERVWLAE
jgi:oxygen-independent coproporphyrinogen-3 oxidase